MGPVRINKLHECYYTELSCSCTKKNPHVVYLDFTAAQSAADPPPHRESDISNPEALPKLHQCLFKLHNLNNLLMPPRKRRSQGTPRAPKLEETQTKLRGILPVGDEAPECAELRKYAFLES